MNATDERQPGVSCQFARLFGKFCPLKTGIQQRDLIKINSANGLGPTIFFL
jgi:hypothetical protein